MVNRWSGVQHKGLILSGRFLYGHLDNPTHTHSSPVKNTTPAKINVTDFSNGHVHI